MLSSAQTSAWTYPSLTETTCTACECSAAAPSKGVPSSPIIEYSTMYNGAFPPGGGGGGGGGGGLETQEALPIGIRYVFEHNLAPINYTQRDHAIA